MNLAKALRAALAAMAAVAFVSGCTTQLGGTPDPRAETERLLLAARFAPVSVDTLEIKSIKPPLPPYKIVLSGDSGDRRKFYFFNPARKTVLVGDLKAYERYSALQQERAYQKGMATLEQYQMAQMREQERRSSGPSFNPAAFGAGLAAAGAAMGGYYAPPIAPVYQQPAAFGRGSRPTTIQRVGNTCFGSDGSTTQRVGNSYFHSDGTSTQRVGNAYFNSGGTTVQKIGSTYFGSDGRTSQQIGNTMFHSDGSTSQRIGNTIFNH